MTGWNKEVVILKREALSGSVSQRTTENKVLLLYYYFWLRAPLVLGRNYSKKYGDLKYAPVLY